MKTTAVLVVLVLFALPGCSGVESSASDKSSSPANGARTTNPTDDDPATSSRKCSDLWVPGQTLPDDYHRCNADADIPMALTGLQCTDRTWLGTYADRFWVQGTGVIAETTTANIADDPAYKATLEACLSG